MITAASERDSAADPHDRIFCLSWQATTQRGFSADFPATFIAARVLPTAGPSIQISSKPLLLRLACLPPTTTRPTTQCHTSKVLLNYCRVAVTNPAAHPNHLPSGQSESAASSFTNAKEARPCLDRRESRSPAVCSPMIAGTSPRPSARVSARIVSGRTAHGTTISAKSSMAPSAHIGADARRYDAQARSTDGMIEDAHRAKDLKGSAARPEPGLFFSRHVGSFSRILRYRPRC